VVVAALALVGLVARRACDGPPEAPAARVRSPSTGGAKPSIRFAISADPRSLEPGLSVMLQDSIIARNLHLGLFAYDAESVLQPYVVTRWSVSDDQLVYTFTLDLKRRWHNGRAIAAADFKEGWERYLSPSIGAWGSEYLTSIAGARAMLDGAATHLRGVDASRPDTLVVQLERPDPDFVLRLGATPTWVAPPEAVVQGQPRWTGTPVGGGPFRFVEWAPKSRVVLEANPASPPAHTERLEFVIAPDAATRLDMYRNGDIDIAPVIESQLGGIKADPILSRELHVWPSAQLIFMGLNIVKIAPFGDRRVRQAFAHAIDRRLISERVMFGAWRPATGIVPPGVSGHDANLGATFDPARARALLAAAGYPGGREFPRLQINVSEPHHVTAAEAVAIQLHEHLGVGFDVRRLESGDLHDRLRNRQFDVFLSGYTADYPSAAVWLYTLLHARAGSNFVGYHDRAFDLVVDAARAEANAEARQRLWREANRLATDGAAVLPLAFGGSSFLVDPALRGVAANLFGIITFDAVSRTGLRSAMP
jgi:oligopeptide transport system substrate-binding protein